MLKLCEDYALKHKIIIMPLKVNFFIFHQTQPECQKIYVKNEERAGHTIY